MKHDRRAFLRSTSLALLAAAFAPQFNLMAASAARSRRPSRSVSFSAADQAVLDWIASYSAKTRIVGASLLGRVRGVPTTSRILAQIPDASLLGEVLTAPMPFTDLYSKENVFAFTFEGERYEVENLLPERFETRVAKLTKRINFGHEALSYNPATQALKDPFKVLASGQLKIVRAGNGVAGGFETLLRAWGEADQLGLKLGPSFSRLKQRVLGAPGKRPALAHSVVSTFVARLPQLTDRLPAEKLIALLQSRLLRTAIPRVLGVDAATVLAQFEALRAAAGDDADAEAVAWLGGLLSTQLQQGIMPDWVDGLDAAQTRRARAALSRAYGLVRESSFQSF